MWEFKQMTTAPPNLFVRWCKTCDGEPPTPVVALVACEWVGADQGYTSQGDWSVLPAVAESYGIEIAYSGVATVFLADQPVKTTECDSCRAQAYAAKKKP